MIRTWTDVGAHEESPQVGEGDQTGPGKKMASRQPTMPLGTVDPVRREPATPPPSASPGTQRMGSVPRSERVTAEAEVVKPPVIAQKDLPPLATDRFLSLTDTETVSLEDDPKEPPSVEAARPSKRERRGALPPVRVAATEREPSALHPTVTRGARGSGVWTALIVSVIAVTLVAAFLLWS